ncbi:pyocin activator PrtN family protein [Rhodobacter capsulatus]|uniref:pyocin activator PrtN family protein n=1 Tax=Rhodobacter capsulatus TaxID=1061 RepID=UPI0003D2F028|nr:pyocin activator PrtN family protein [Rhodobacter capsulatus]ETD87245.1 Pyocin activator protein PrtN [Rhodobacter capsulatus B6]
MKTAWMLMARYDGLPVLPLDIVCRDFFSHLTPAKLSEKVDKGEIRLPVVRIEKSQKAAKGVHLADLAAWIDARRAEAEHECRAMSGR